MRRDWGILANKGVDCGERLTLILCQSPAVFAIVERSAGSVAAALAVCASSSSAEASLTRPAPAGMSQPGANALRRCRRRACAVLFPRSLERTIADGVGLGDGRAATRQPFRDLGGGFRALNGASGLVVSPLADRREWCSGSRTAYTGVFGEGNRGARALEMHRGRC